MRPPDEFVVGVKINYECCECQGWSQSRVAKIRLTERNDGRKDITRLVYEDVLYKYVVQIRRKESIKNNTTVTEAAGGRFM